MLTASGPLRATLFLSMLSIVSSGITVLPSFSRGVTSTGSHLIGVYKAMSVSFRGEINSANHYISCLEDVLHRLGNLWADTIALNQTDSVKSLSHR